jgi:hypothetical protein
VIKESVAIKDSADAAPQPAAPIRLRFEIMHAARTP